MPMPSPWPDEKAHLRASDIRFCRKYGGTLTNKVLDLAIEAGALDPDPGWFAEIDVRCTFQKAGEFQHHRTAWHRDQSKKSWIYVEGPGPTQMREGDKVWDVEQGILVQYDDMEHRCPEQPEDGWRYFFRVLWLKRPTGCFVKPTFK